LRARNSSAPTFDKPLPEYRADSDHALGAPDAAVWLPAAVGSGVWIQRVDSPGSRCPSAGRHATL